MKRTGLFGGTFNPIHIGHMKMAEAARKQFKLDVVYFIPCGIPPHKQKKELLPSRLRLKLIKTAIKGKKYFKVLDIELKSKKPSYTVNTIKQISHKPLATSHQLFFLIGVDEFNNLRMWKSPNELAKLVTFLVLPRKSYKIKIPKVKNLKYKIVKTKKVNISSSKIRKHLS